MGLNFVRNVEYIVKKEKKNLRKLIKKKTEIIWP